VLELEVPSDSVGPDRRVIAVLAFPNVVVRGQPVHRLLVLLTTSILGECSATAWLGTLEWSGMLEQMAVQVTASFEGFRTASATVLVVA
jgi:hypothetical protein